jgi:predicted dehydrogenase
VLKVAVVGVGHLGQHHARLASELERLVAVVDVNARRAWQVARRYGARAVGLEEALSLADCLIIATPPDSHTELALRALRAGRDVLVEKPLGGSPAGAKAILREASRRGLLVAAGHVERFNPASQAMFRRLKGPRFFHARRLSPFLRRASDIDVVLDLMVHDLDLVLSALGWPRVLGVRARGVSLRSAHLDEACAWVQFQGGAAALFEASRLRAERKRMMRVYHEVGVLEVDFMHRAVGGRRLKGQEPLRAELRAFFRSVRSRQAPLVDAGQALGSLELAHRIIQEARRQGP